MRLVMKLEWAEFLEFHVSPELALKCYEASQPESCIDFTEKEFSSLQWAARQMECSWALADREILGLQSYLGVPQATSGVPDLKIMLQLNEDGIHATEIGSLLGYTKDTVEYKINEFRSKKGVRKCRIRNPTQEAGTQSPLIRTRLKRRIEENITRLASTLETQGHRRHCTA